MTYREALRLALREELARDERVFLMGEEVGVFDGSYKVTAGLLDEFGPDRVRDTPISEEGFVGAGVGAAMLGERPVVEIMTINFLLVAMDQVVNHAAKIGAMFGGEVRCPLVIRTPERRRQPAHRPALAVVRGWFAGTPGLKVVAPATPADAKGLLKAAIRDDDPVLVIENLPIYKEKGEVPLDPEFLTPIGRAAVAREGTDLTIVVALLRDRARAARRRAARRRARRLRRGRRPALAAPARRRDGRRVGRQDQPRVCVEEGWPTYGVTAELAARIQKACFDDLDAPVERVGMAEVPLPYAKNLETAALPNEERVQRGRPEHARNLRLSKTAHLVAVALIVAAALGSLRSRPLRGRSPCSSRSPTSSSTRHSSCAAPGRSTTPPAAPDRRGDDRLGARALDGPCGSSS